MKKKSKRTEESLHYHNRYGFADLCLFFVIVLCCFSSSSFFFNKTHSFELVEVYRKYNFILLTFSFFEEYKKKNDKNNFILLNNGNYKHGFKNLNG